MSGTLTADSGVLRVPALPASVDYFSREPFIVRDVTGAPVVALSMVPSVFVARTMSALRKGRSRRMRDRVESIAQAVDAFQTDVVDELSLDDYRALASRISGLPIATVDAAIEGIVAAGRAVEDSIRLATPAGASADWSDPDLSAGGALWTRRGETLAIHAAGNSPGIHASWLQALALGFRIAVRPSRRDPLTPYRLVSVLRRAGFANDNVVLLPTDYSAAHEILRDADLAIVWGGDELVSKYATNPDVLTQGPGRSKVVITDDVDWRKHLDTIVASIAAGGGASCMNTTALFVEGDVGRVAEAVTDRLRALPSCPPQDARAALPVMSEAAASEVESYLLSKAIGTRAWLGADGIVDPLPDGSAVLRPAVMEVDDCNDPRLGVELPFPCVWIAPWSRADGVAPLRGTLALTALVADRDLMSALINDPGISNVNVGATPTHWSRTGLPHDDYLASFLMRAKTVRTNF